MWRIHIDTIDLGNYESDSGNCFVLFGVDALTKFVEGEGNFTFSNHSFRSENKCER